MCPTYQTTVTPWLLMASAEAEKAKGKMDRLALSTHSLCLKWPSHLSNLASPFHILKGCISLPSTNKPHMHDRELAGTASLGKAGHRTAISMAAQPVQWC